MLSAQSNSMHYKTTHLREHNSAFVEPKAAFAGCADLNLAGRAVEEGLCRKFIDAVVMTILSGQSVIKQSLHVTFW